MTEKQKRKIALELLRGNTKLYVLPPDPNPMKMTETQFEVFLRGTMFLSWCRRFKINQDDRTVKWEYTYWLHYGKVMRARIMGTWPAN